MSEIKKSVRAYLLGFTFSILLTLAAYFLVVSGINPQPGVISKIVIIPSILVFALLQLIVQLTFFLHLGKESRPKWNLVFFITTFCTIVVVIVASIWIMDHLNYNMNQTQINQYINDQSGF